jgi:hypothetical protein
MAASSSERLRCASSAARRASSSAGDAAAGAAIAGPAPAAAGGWDDAEDDRARERLTPTPESGSGRAAEGASWSDFLVFLMLSALNAGSSSRAVFFAAADDPLSALEPLDLDFT